jgi:hypothetical protein
MFKTIPWLLLLTLLVTDACAQTLQITDKELATLADSLEKRMPAERSPSIELPQTVIPRYADGREHPAGTLTGVYRATKDTASQPVPAVVVTEDYGEKLAQWRGGSTVAGLKPAVLQPRIRDVTIQGMGGSSRPESNAGRPDLYDGILVNASGAVVDNLHVFGIPGTAGVFTRPNNPRSGPVLEWDRNKHELSNLSASDVFRGFYIAGVDNCVRNVAVRGFRDYGVRLGNAIYASELHAWGGTGPGIWLDGNGGRVTSLYGENTTVGILADCSGSSVLQIRAHTCWDCCLRVNGHKNHFGDLQLDASKIGIEVNDQHNRFDGRVNAADGATCVVLNNAIGQQIDLTLGMYGQPQARGLVATTSNVNYCDIKLLVSGGEVGADFSAGLGIRNVIRVTTKDGTKTPIVLPKKWDASNEIIVNGVKQ